MDGIRLHPRLTDADGENESTLSGIAPAPLYRVQVQSEIDLIPARVEV